MSWLDTPLRAFIMPVINPAHQMVILARLSEYCQFHGATLYHEQDPWEYMRRKLQETEPALEGLKGELLAAVRAKLFAELKEGPIDSERFADFRVLFERLLGPGDFADVAIHLAADGSSGDSKLRALAPLLRSVKPTNLFVEERKPLEARPAAWEKLVRELTVRLDIERLGAILARKPRTGRRKRMALRRLRRNVAEYCCVLHIPTDASQTFTPFMLPRIEGLIAANLRLLNKHR
ncbi:MAG: hypothetical protein HY924_01435 [Elusimicrobia bacterium]|nr:hypothetical protein [Elusimicrobiota bacterium]